MAHTSSFPHLIRFLYFVRKKKLSINNCTRKFSAWNTWTAMCEYMRKCVQKIQIREQRIKDLEIPLLTKKKISTLELNPKLTMFFLVRIHLSSRKRWIFAKIKEVRGDSSTSFKIFLDKKLRNLNRKSPNFLQETFLKYGNFIVQKICKYSTEKVIKSEVFYFCLKLDLIVVFTFEIQPQ